MRELKFRCFNKVTHEMTDPCFRPCHHDKYVQVIQYIGLKDKNDKEIYEGDIVIFDSQRDKFYFKGPITSYIEYVTILAMFGIKDPKSLGHFDFIGYELEVIGNIYENPELLNEN